MHSRTIAGSRLIDPRFVKLQAFCVMVCLLIMASASGPAAAQALEVPFTLPAKLAGVGIDIPLKVEVTPNFLGGPSAFVIRADLTPVFANIEAIVIGSGLDHPEGVPDFEYKGTAVDVQGEQLWLKYHFNVLSSNGSVEGLFSAQPNGGTVGFAAQGFKLNVSNDLLRGAVKALDLDRKFTERLAQEVQQMLASPEAQLGLPPEIRGATADFTSARFTRIGNVPTLEASGNLQLGLEILMTLLSRLTSGK